MQAVSRGIREAAAAAGIDLVECDSGWTRDGVQACADRAGRRPASTESSASSPSPTWPSDVCAATGDAPTIGIVYDQGPCQVSLLRDRPGRVGPPGRCRPGRSFAAERWDCEVKAYVSLESGADDPIGGARMQGYRDGYEEHCELPEQSRSLDDAQHLATAQTQMRDVLEEAQGQAHPRRRRQRGRHPRRHGGRRGAGSRRTTLWYSGQLAEPAIRQTIACDEHYVASVAQFPERFGSSAGAGAHRCHRGPRGAGHDSSRARAGDRRERSPALPRHACLRRVGPRSGKVAPR